MNQKGNQSLIPSLGDFYMKLLDSLDDERTSRIDAMEDKVTEVESAMNLMATGGLLERGV